MLLDARLRPSSTVAQGQEDALIEERLELFEEDSELVCKEIVTVCLGSKPQIQFTR